MVIPKGRIAIFILRYMQSNTYLTYIYLSIFMKSGL